MGNTLEKGSRNVQNQSRKRPNRKSEQRSKEFLNSPNVQRNDTQIISRQPENRGSEPNIDTWDIVNAQTSATDALCIQTQHFASGISKQKNDRDSGGVFVIESVPGDTSRSWLAGVKPKSDCASDNISEIVKPIPEPSKVIFKKEPNIEIEAVDNLEISEPPSSRTHITEGAAAVADSRYEYRQSNQPFSNCPLSNQKGNITPGISDSAYHHAFGLGIKEKQSGRVDSNIWPKIKQFETDTTAATLDRSQSSSLQAAQRTSSMSVKHDFVSEMKIIPVASPESNIKCTKTNPTEDNFTMTKAFTSSKNLQSVNIVPDPVKAMSKKDDNVQKENTTALARSLQLHSTDQSHPPREIWTKPKVKQVPNLESRVDLAEPFLNVNIVQDSIKSTSSHNHNLKKEAAASLHVHMTGTVVVLKDNFGFIKPDESTELKQTVHFQKRNASQGITAKQRVFFLLSEKCTKQKPSAKSVWFCLDDSSSRSVENKIPAKEKHENDSHIKDRLPANNSLTGKIVRVIPGNAELKKSSYGFISPSKSLPQGYTQDKNVHFIVNHVQSAGLELIAGDTLEFVLGIRNKEKPTAFQAKLVNCRQRPVKVVEQYISNLHERVSTGHQSDKLSTKDICDLLACIPVWRCVANTSQLSNEGVRMFMELIVKLGQKSRGFEGNFKFVMKEITKSSFFNPTTGKLKQFIEMLKLKPTDGNVPNLLKDFVLVILKHVPEMARPLVRMIKPLVSGKDTSVETFLYELLILTSKAQGTCMEYMLWDEVPLVPAPNELFHEFLAKDLLEAKKKGEYSSVEEYFEVYFRLLREDCFHALKKGVQGLLKGNLDPRDMSVFQCIKLCGVHLNEFECSLSIGLKVKPLNRKKNWNSGNSLMFGNLVCITTSGNFGNNIWGTVMSRELLQSHDIVLIQLSSSGNTMSSAEIICLLDASRDRVIVVESPTYYKAFEPVLKTLQKMKPDHIPFQEELVKVQKSQCLLYEGQRSMKGIDIVRSQFVTPDEAPLEYIQSNDLAGLDPSQVRAIKHALSKRLAIIQGPPGTGKTYIGVKVIKILESMGEIVKLPILVLTYKNHALDEFLKDMIKLFPGNVARIGGRSKDEILQKCNLNEIKRTHRMPVDQFKMVKEYKADIESLKDAIEKELVDLHASQELSISTLKIKLSHSQIQQILLGCNWSKTSVSSLQQTDIDGYTAVKSKKKGNIKITEAEAKEIINKLDQNVASFLESKDSEENKLWIHLNRMTEAALQQWVPTKSKFEEIIGQFGVNISSINVEGDLSANSEATDDKDAEEEEKERLASHAEGPKNGRSVLKEMLFLPTDSQKSKWMPQLDFNSVKLIQDAPLLFYTNIVNPWELNERDRVIYIQTLLHQLFEEKKTTFESLLTQYEEVITAKQEIEERYKIDILKKMTVVGMTITGASIHNHLLSELRPAVVIIEEAGEVLEPQILPVLGDWVKHLILIGDHKQLRPSVESYELARHYHLDISMMERLINNDLDYESLQMQNRMREEFAELLLDIYPNLQSNTYRVRNNASPSCVQTSMYFWTHSDPETEERSYKNEAEAQRAIKLALFLIQQEYKPSQVTILGAYQGQVSMLRKMMAKAEENHSSIFENHKNVTSKNDEGKKGKNATDSSDTEDDEEEIAEKVQIQTVDNYQGDENDIVIVSLVRSNDKQKVGFLNTLNRRCVAQSRARCGMYFLGNKHTLASSANWSVVIQKLQEKGCVGTNLTLKCPRHPTVTISARTAEDITLGSFCKAKCSMVMSCEIHHCKRLCQPSHSHRLCNEVVAFVFEKCNHMGKRKCFEHESEQLCRTELPITFKSCGHTGKKLCFKSDADTKCLQKCTKILPCQHMCTMKCSEPCSIDSCDMCEELRKEKEERERKAKEAERKKIHEEVLEEIERVRKSDKELYRFELQPVGETASEYNDVEDRVKKYIQIGHKWFPVVKKIEKVENTGLRLKWLQYRSKMFDPTYEALKFHGTSAEAVDAIIEKGFIMPKPAGQMYGPGIYFATDSSKSAQEMYTKGSNMLLLCKVLLGKTYTVDSAQKDMTCEMLKKKKCDSLYAVRDTRTSGGVLYDEYVVFDKRQALPQYVVHYTNVNVDDAASLMQSLEENAITNKQLVKHNVVPKREIKMDDPLDIHLRIAEAQFQRLLKSQKYTAAATQIKSLDYYINPPLLQKFQAKAKEFKQKFKNGDEAGYIFGFHGTKPENIPSIVKENFSVAHLAKNTGNRGAYGAGIYFSEFPSVSLGYGGSLLLCKVLPGKSYDIQPGDRNMHGAPLKTGYDSHRVRKDADGRGHELVIFDPDQILPCYVINL